MKNWEEKDIVVISDSVKTQTVVVTFEAVKGATGILTSVWAMHYTEYNKDNPMNSKALYSGYTIFKGSIEKDGKELHGTIVMSDDGEYDSMPTILHSKVISAFDDLKHVKNVKKFPRGGKEESQVEFDL